jgi:hypothetical protein
MRCGMTAATAPFFSEGGHVGTMNKEIGFVIHLPMAFGAGGMAALGHILVMTALARGLTKGLDVHFMRKKHKTPVAVAVDNHQLYGLSLILCRLTL